MSSNLGRDGWRSALATGAAVVLAGLCCGLPLLLPGGALAGLGSVLGSPWVIAAAVALIAVAVVWRVRH